jgi:short-subunit dehydrogenase
VRDVNGRRILITGASSGIGRAVAEQTAAAGASLILAARSGDKLAELAERLRERGTTPIPVAADVTVSEDRQRLLDVATDRLGGLDVLINNAGVAGWGHFVEATEDLLRQIMEVNFFAPAELIRLAIPVLAQGVQPAIVNVASMCGRRALPAWSEYSASKYALVGFSDALRGELVRFGIDVLVVLPGLTRSDLGRNLLRDAGRLKLDFSKGMAPATVAAGILDALRRNRKETVLGGDAKWMLRLNRWMPWLVDRLLARKVRRLYAEELRERQVAAARF